MRMGVTTVPLGQGGGPRWGCTWWWVMVRVGVPGKGGPRARGSQEGTHLAVSNGEGGGGHTDHHGGGCRGLP